MRTLVVYESMYGNTHTIAEAIAAGARLAGDANVVPVDRVRPDEVTAADLVVVGGPTHVHGMSRPSTRQGAVDALADHPDLALDPDAEGPGVREWLDGLARSAGGTTGRATAFDTRVDVSPILSGRASKGIAKALRRHGFELVADPESFLVTKETHLVDGEEGRARDWGERIATTVAGALATTTTTPS